MLHCHWVEYNNRRAAVVVVVVQDAVVRIVVVVVADRIVCCQWSTVMCCAALSSLCLRYKSGKLLLRSTQLTAWNHHEQIRKLSPTVTLAIVICFLFVVI